MTRQFVGRPGTKTQLCEGCGVRLTVGEPATNTVWAQRLVLDERVIKDLTEAAAEFDQLTERAEVGRFTALDFIDWLTPSVRGRVEPPFFDGAPPRNVDGSLSSVENSKGTRHPFPLPTQGNGERHTRGRRAS